MGKKFVVILHIHGARAIFPIFCVNNDTEYKECEIEMILSQPIFTQKNRALPLCDNDIHALQDE